MPKPASFPNGAPCWIDLYTSDPDAATEFYGRLFGWDAESAGEEYGGYVNFSKDGELVGGCMKNEGTDGAPDVWSVYLATDDAKATTDAAAARGGQILVPAMDVVDLGVMAVVIDPGQASVGVWQPGSHRGFGVFGEPGTPNWFELHTRDYDAAVAFYRDVFGWDGRVMSDRAEFRYTTVGEGDAQLAGIIDAAAFMPAGVPAHWSIYLGVDEADAALTAIVALGGAVLRPAQDSPYGRVAHAADPTGATFKIVQST